MNPVFLLRHSELIRKIIGGRLLWIHALITVLRVMHNKFFYVVNHRCIFCGSLLVNFLISLFNIGMLAAEATFSALHDGSNLESYWETLRNSWIWEELHRARNYRPVSKHIDFSSLYN